MITMCDRRIGNQLTQVAANNDEIETNMINLVKKAAEKDGLINLRVETNNSDNFSTFVNYCLINLTSSVTWRYRAYNTIISDIFTVSDEALCILLIENLSYDFIQTHETKKEVNRKDSKPRYTKAIGQSEGNKLKPFKGWNHKGIKRYNKLIKTIIEHRKTDESMQLENELKDRYALLCGQNDGSITNDNNDTSSSSDEDEDDNIHAYDGFSCINIASV